MPCTFQTSNESHQTIHKLMRKYSRRDTDLTQLNFKEKKNHKTKTLTKTNVKKL